MMYAGLIATIAWMASASPQLEKGLWLERAKAGEALLLTGEDKKAFQAFQDAADHYPWEKESNPDLVYIAELSRRLGTIDGETQRWEEKRTSKSELSNVMLAYLELARGQFASAEAHLDACEKSEGALPSEFQRRFGGVKAFLRFIAGDVESARTINTAAWRHREKPIRENVLDSALLVAGLSLYGAEADKTSGVKDLKLAIRKLKERGLGKFPVTAKLEELLATDLRPRKPPQ